MSRTLNRMATSLSIPWFLGLKAKPSRSRSVLKQMHEDSELGVAAHWKYKEGSSGGRSGYDEKITWLRKLLDWQEEMSDSGEMLDEVRSQVFDDRVYAFTPRGDVVDLPMGATPLDFAYHIHSDGRSPLYRRQSRWTYRSVYS